MKCLANGEELLGVYGGLVVDALEIASGCANFLSEPSIGAVLAPKFVTDKVAYVYLHSVGYLCAGYRFLECVFRRPQG